MDKCQGVQHDDIQYSRFKKGKNSKSAVVNRRNNLGQTRNSCPEINFAQLEQNQPAINPYKRNTNNQISQEKRKPLAEIQTNQCKRFIKLNKLRKKSNNNWDKTKCRNGSKDLDDFPENTNLKNQNLYNSLVQK